MDVTLSIYLIVGVVAWASAQLAKYLIKSLRTKNFRQVNLLYLSGDMPSAHTATVVAMTTVIGLVDGIDSGLFALAAIFSAVVMYDAVMVRRSSGEQGAALLAYFKEIKRKVVAPRVAKGHTPLEVLVGALWGFSVACVVFFATTNQ
jgi:uncharacterized protein